MDPKYFYYIKNKINSLAGLHVDVPFRPAQIYSLGKCGAPALGYLELEVIYILSGYLMGPKIR